MGKNGKKMVNNKIKLAKDVVNQKVRKKVIFE